MLMSFLFFSPFGEKSFSAAHQKRREKSISRKLDDLTIHLDQGYFG